jgi:radical SAM superfamily enzyme YgiQ (UPF0313 family)
MTARSLDLLLINPGGRKIAYQNLGENLAAKEPPIWVGLLAEHARRHGHSVEILDANVDDLTFAETATYAAERRALLTALVVYGHNPNASTQVMPAAREVCRMLKSLDPHGQVLLLGGHVAALPEQTLREECADFVCDGEGPITIHELLGALRGGITAELAKVRGLCYFDGDVVTRNNPAPIITDLDAAMPSMAWDLLDIEKYRSHNWHCFGGRDRQPYAALYTTLGCPFRCAFCCIQAPFRSGEKALGYKPNVNSYRRFAPANIVAQIDSLARHHGVSNFKFADELFVAHKGHVEAICDGLIASGHDLNIWAYARVDTCNDIAMLRKMRQAGVRWLAIGIESASEHVRDDVDKGYKPEKLRQTLRRVQNEGIYIVGNYIFGLPEDDSRSMRETLDFAKDANTEYANFYSAMAYPGSALYRDALKQGWTLPKSWDGYSQFSRTCLPLPTRHLSSAEVLRFRDAAFHEYFDRPAFKTMFAATFGVDALAEVEQMTTQPLARDLLSPKTSTVPV